MTNILMRVWNLITGCFRRQLDNEIERVIEAHEQRHASHAQIPIIINNWHDSPRTKRRRYAVADLTQAEGYDELKRSLRL